MWRIRGLGDVEDVVEWNNTANGEIVIKHNYLTGSRSITLNGENVCDIKNQQNFFGDTVLTLEQGKFSIFVIHKHSNEYEYRLQINHNLTYTTRVAPKQHLKCWEITIDGAEDRVVLNTSQNYIWANGAKVAFNKEVRGNTTFYNFQYKTENSWIAAQTRGQATSYTLHIGNRRFAQRL